MKKGGFFAVIYMFLTTAVCSALLIGLSRGTSERVEANRQIAEEKTILSVFPEIRYRTDAEAHAIFEAHFEKSEQAGGAYVYRKDDAVAGYAVPISGQGFWAEIAGYVGVAPDRQTITGIGFYEQSETPGLGARIVEPEFLQRFAGLRIQPPPQPVNVVPPGAPLSEGEVHGISGATQTVTRLETIINRGLSEWLSAMRREEDQQ